MKRKTRNRKRKHIKKRNTGGASYSPRTRRTNIDAESDPDLNDDLKMALSESPFPIRRRSASFTTSYMRKKNSNSPSTVKQKRNTPNGAPRIYHPPLDIVFDIPTNTYQMKPFNYKYDLPLPLSKPDEITGLYKSPTTDKYRENDEDVKNQKILRIINANPSAYRYLAPKLYDLLNDDAIKTTHVFAYALVIGRIRDELIPFMRITNPDIIGMRLGINQSDTQKIMSIITIDPSSERSDLTPADRVLSQARIDNYNAHPMFSAPIQIPDIPRMTPSKPITLEEAMTNTEANLKLEKQDNVLVWAHGEVGKKLSQRMVQLSNKYFRIIELGTAGDPLSLTNGKSTPLIEINKALRNVDENRDYGSIFENTSLGNEQRQMLFHNISPYFGTASKPSTFNLVDITHDRIISGDARYRVQIIRDDHKITYKSMLAFASMGIFSPVDYENDTSTNHLSKKELFKLYTNTAFLTAGKQIELIGTLLPYAIQSKTRINIIIAACGGITPRTVITAPPSTVTTYPDITDDVNSSLLVKAGKRYLFAIKLILSYLTTLTDSYEKYIESATPFNRKVIINYYRLMEITVLKNKLNMKANLDKMEDYFTFKVMFPDNLDENLRNIADLDPSVQRLVKTKLFLIKEFNATTINIIQLYDLHLDVLLKASKLADDDEMSIPSNILKFVDKIKAVSMYIFENQAGLFDNGINIDDLALDNFYEDIGDSFIYKYKELPNYDDAMNRRQSIKKKLYSQNPNRVKSRVKGDRRFDLSL